MVYIDSQVQASSDRMKGLDITAPPSLPRHYMVRKGGRGGVYEGGDSEDEEEDINSVLNTGMLAGGDTNSD